MSNRDERLDVRINATESRQLDRVAQSLNLTRSEAVRSLVEKEAKKLNKT